VGREVLKLEAELLQQQQVEKRDWQRQPAGEEETKNTNSPAARSPRGVALARILPVNAGALHPSRLRTRLSAPLGLKTLGMNLRGHGDYGDGKHKSANAKGRGELGGEMAQQLERMRKRNCCTRGESLSRQTFPLAPRDAAENLARCAPKRPSL
jgi:hypothetical protein